ncbi:DUF262 domain-containing protein [Trichocoleus sp. DQ-A3]|uniref:GmrSD restriction endonuclease domain-containing protein n=1 Tax=Cyanophyceae TaxID=3028117 RepID=UPI001685E2A0|nr:DUF262 domain-containing protein [Coleofasciculus sp. FACHB-125]MBD1902877.1 DUF262 domain-containing protein [Coleofasciculus sp. FACHB-125]
MPPVKNFDSKSIPLLDLLRSTKEGKAQLPDFQRSWVWNDDQVCSLLASISLSYPIGAVMMLETGNPDVRFQPRPIEGVTLNNPTEPEELILDGQQRLTSLFQTLLSGKAVKTKDTRGKEIYRWYYINIAKALDPTIDREEAIVSVPEDKIIRNFRKEIVADYSTSEKEYQNEMFPISQTFYSSDWMTSYNEYWDYQKEKVKLVNKFNNDIVKQFEHYDVPVILLHQETPREAVCQVFEKMNTGGISLTVFELVTATFAADKFNLREDWATREKALKIHQVLRDIENTDFLQAVTLLATLDKSSVSCKRKDVLNLSLEQYKEWADLVTLGFEQAAKFLHTQKIFSDRELPYQTQLTALAAIFAALGDRVIGTGAIAKLANWYWCGVFGELYNSAIESRLAKDVPQVRDWINGCGAEPDTIRDANFAPDRLLSLYTRRSAAYKGLSALLLRDGGCDFFTSYPIDTLMEFNESIDIHHIFPRHWCHHNGIAAEVYDCAINKTPLSAKTNKMIGGKAPSIYLTDIEKKSDILEDNLNEILRSHVIDPASLRTDNFDAFFQARKNALLDRIEKAMGKPILREAAKEIEN